MPLPVDENLPTSFPKPEYLTLGNFRRGVVTLINESRLAKNTLAEAVNLFLYEDGQPGVRPGIDWFGAAAPNGEPITGFDYFDFDGAIHLVIVAGKEGYRSTDDGATWDALEDGNAATELFNETLPVEMNQNGDFLYMTQAGENILRYDGTTTLQEYVALATPSAPSAAVTGSGSSYTYYYKTVAVNEVGVSLASPADSITIGTRREDWDTSTNYVTLTIDTFQSGQDRADIYLSEDGITYYYLASSTGTTWKDDGTAQIAASTLEPTSNTTQGPKVARLRNVGGRQYGVGDPENRYRIWFSGGYPYSGAFVSGFGGGYLDWQPGGKLYPVDVEDYRSGKGDPVATVWMDSADGQGGILQMSITDVAVGDVTVSLPSAYLLPGSRGTPAPGSVVNVLNDFFFYNSQAIYNLGPRAQFLNIISTDEASANIRPNFRRVTRSAESGIASAYFEANVYFSLPIGSDANNTTAIYNTELQAWIPEAFNVGFKKFLRYTDTNKGQHLLALKPGDNRLSEISTGIQGDYGEAFETSLLTGLYPTTKDRFEFQFVEEAEVEFSDPQGRITVEVLGIDRPFGFKSILKIPITATSSVVNAGWDTFAWDVNEWDDTSDVPQTFSESSVKRYTPVQRELNAIQWHVVTRSVDARYILRTLQSWGTSTQAGHPPAWRVKAL